MQSEDEWLLFSEPNNRQLFCLLKDMPTEVTETLKQQITTLLPSVTDRIETLYPRAVKILEPTVLLLLLAGLRSKGVKEMEIPLYKGIESVGKNNHPKVYECLQIKCKKLPDEGWLYYAVKDIAGNRREQVKGIAKHFLLALWEDIKEFGPHWNSVHNYRITYD
ncbi:hypothetical protein NERG_01864 [Nematocida ausubeli]|uniref:Uncharacterized protein n=1 Tax=Nematocida ausubeli (strain ATCC PRA-371 / ERTm2) TaxID=1913371 RepID=H8ZE43_NEMA1|nr:hypothetical protein NERG_01864 [Nematocida ausubeli]